MMNCPNPDCKKPISVREAYCPHCGEVITRAGVTNIISQNDEDATFRPIGTANFNQHTLLRLRLPEQRVHFDFNADEVNEITIGRRDVDTNTLPTVDLNPYDGLEKGVSRRHAVILRKSNQALYVKDDSSNNGTFLNGQKLVPGQERVLRDGDELRLGHLIVMVIYTRVDLDTVNRSSASKPANGTTP